MGIYTVVGAAVADAHILACNLSMKRPQERILALVTRDTGTEKLFLSWASVQQDLAAADILCGAWFNGKKEE